MFLAAGIDTKGGENKFIDQAASIGFEEYGMTRNGTSTKRRKAGLDMSAPLEDQLGVVDEGNIATSMEGMLMQFGARGSFNLTPIEADPDKPKVSLEGDEEEQAMYAAMFGHIAT